MPIREDTASKRIFAVVILYGDGLRMNMVQERALRVDFFRGLALVFMFWDHLPGNPAGYLTVRNLGLSDAAEIFVFLSGYSAMSAYSKIALRDGYSNALQRILMRVWRLYVMHIFILVALMGIVFALDRLDGPRDFIAEMGMGYFLTDAPATIVNSFTLQFKPNLMDPLPLYIILMLTFVVILPLLIRYPLKVIAASGGIYSLAVGYDINLPNQGGEHWFFNPLAWQFLFCLGALCARFNINPSWKIGLWSRVLLALALICVAYSAILAISWKLAIHGDPRLHALIMPSSIGAVLYEISKTNLAPARLIHFLALAFSISVFVPAGQWLHHGFGSIVRVLGRHSLEVFCLSILLSPLATAFADMFLDHWAAHFIVAFTGVVLMIGLAVFLEYNKGGERKKLQPIRAVQPPVN